MKNIILIVFLLLNAPAFAAWTNGQQVVKNVIWIENHKGFYVSPELFDSNLLECTYVNLYLIDSSVLEKDVDRLYSMMLTGFATGSKMTLMLSGNCSANGYVTFTGLQINK